MVSSTATTAEDYLAELPADRRAAISAVRDLVRSHLPAGFEETMQYGMISYVVPLSTLPDTYNGQPLAVASLASQKNHMSLYLNSIYADPAEAAWFTEAYRRTGKRLDVGKSCVRFRSLDALPLDLVGEAIARTSAAEFVARYHASRGAAAGKT